MLFAGAWGSSWPARLAGKVLDGRVSCDDRVLARGRIVSVPERTARRMAI